jgi:hypothetical protein
MVVVAGADNERVHLGDIDLQNFEVIRVNAGREAEVEQVATGFQTFAGLDVQCQPPLAFQGPALLCLRKSHAADRETGRLGSPKGDIVRVIGDLPDNDLVNGPAHRSGQERRGQTDQVVCCMSAANRQARPDVAEKYGGPASAACAISSRIFIDPDFLVPSLSRRLPNHGAGPFPEEPLGTAGRPLPPRRVPRHERCLPPSRIGNARQALGGSDRGRAIQLIDLALSS